MAQKLDWSAWKLGLNPQREAINHNAEELDEVQATLTSLSAIVKRQAQEILQLRATLIGALEVLHARVPFDADELDRAARAAFADLTAPPPRPSAPPASTDPYRNMPVEPPPAAVRLVLCPRCGKQVPSTQTTITENGEVCDACA